MVPGPYSGNHLVKLFNLLEVYPNTTTTYIASITDANNCISTDTLVLDVLCSNETLVDFEPFIVENETQALFPNVSSFDKCFI